RKIELLRSSTSFDNENYRYHLELGCLYLATIPFGEIVKYSFKDEASASRQDLLKSAIRELKIAIEKNPFDVTGFFYLGKLHFQMREYHRAEEYFYKCIILEPNFFYPWYFLSKCSEKTGKVSRAKFEIAKFSSIKAKLKNHELF
ncbi:MAG: hypothetical protein QME68_02775, partial [Elusimicrobiota bacterium]|nr:hypothetical protein [Elusimicrobiota bacterium]